MMRHALAPGTGDPSNFDIDNCRTQRNLSATGRQQAREIGAYLKDSFKHAEIGSVKVFSSQWCRCKETARLLNLGEVVKLPIINSFFQNRSQGRPQTQALTTWLAEQDKQQITILVTHQVNITALTGIFPNSGEMIVFTLDENNTPRVITRLLPSKPA
ncbi:MAG: histidine phosphatase family protein [Pseudomonadota bacterium]